MYDPLINLSLLGGREIKDFFHLCLALLPDLTAQKKTGNTHV